MDRISLKGFLKTLSRAGKAYLVSGVASELSAHPGRVTSNRELVEAVYGHNFEPEYADACIKIAIWRLRKQGFSITRHPYRGFSHEGDIHGRTTPTAA